MSFEICCSVTLLVALFAGCSAPQPGHELPAPQPSALPVVETAPAPTATEPAPSATASVAASVVAPPAGPSYVACGCGCCGETQAQDACLYKSKGDSLDKIIAQDKIAAKSSICPMAGCSLGVRYHYCD